MEKENLKTKKITTKTTAKPDLPPPPPKATTKKVASKTPTTKKETELPNWETIQTETKIEVPSTLKILNQNINPTAKNNIYNIDLINDYTKKKDLPIWAYWVFVPLIFFMLLFIIVFAIGAAAYTG
ncbi:MAG: hypothetical protein PHQ62_03020 [Clostridia bacterium]|nr:hypothetical protein [Clostridia bacterium]